MYRISALDGTKLAVYDWNPSGEKTELLIHGWPLSHKIYEYQLLPLLACGYRVVAMDLRGFGASDVADAGYTYDQMATDIYCVVCQMQLKSFSLVGFSMGGAIALRYMRLFNGFGVEQLVLLAAAAPSWTKRADFPYGLSRADVDALIDQAATDRPQLARTFSHEQLFASPQSEAVKDWFEQIALSASGIATVQCAIALRDEDGRPDLAAVKVPTAIIHGAKDVVVSGDLARIQQQSIKGARRYTLENSGHGIMYDELKRFNTLFLAVLAGEK